MSRYFGIDFGTSTIYITQWNEEKQEARPVENMGTYGKGGNFFKNLIYYESPTKIIVGDLAYSKGIVNPENYVASIKRLLENDEWKQPIKSLDGRSLSSLDIATDIFRWIKNKVEENMGEEKIDGVVISVPFAFQNKERMKIKTAAENAGLNVMALIEEPVAAAICFGLFDDVKEGSKEKILIFDLGGGTFDVTIFELKKESSKSISLEVITTDGHKSLGGKDVDDLIRKKFQEDLQRKFPFYKLENMDERQRRQDLIKLTEHAESLKENLSTSDFESVFVATLFNNAILEMDVTKEDFDEWLKRNGFLSKIKEVLESSLDEAELEPSDISKIILVGGSTKIGAVKETVEKFFGRRPEAIKNPGELVGEGAGIYCGCLLNQSLDYKIVTRVSYAIGINSGNKFDTFIRRNSKYDEYSDIRHYYIKNKDKCRIKIYQGNSGSDLSKCSEVGLINVDASVLDDETIGLQLGTDRNGIIKYRIYNKQSKLIQEGVVNSNGPI